MSDAKVLPSLSVVITTHEQHDALQEHLPMVLQQDYPADFEVIVVDMNSTDETLSLLEQMAKRYPCLHTIQIPPTARDISPVRLALTLGIRAASYDWVVLTDANCQPASVNWLSRMGECCMEREATEIVLGSTLWVGGKGWHGLRCRFFHAWQQQLNLSFAQKHGAYRCDGTNLCYRRSLFLEHRGFADDANLMMGATDIMVNRHSRRRNTAVCLHPEARMLQETPRYRSWWNEERLFFMETRRHFKRSLLYRMGYLGRVLSVWLPTLGAAMGIGWAVYRHHDAIAIAVAVLWILYNLTLTYSFNKRLKATGEHFPFAYIPLLHLVPWWDGTAWLQWLFTKQQTFRKKAF